MAPRVLILGLVIALGIVASQANSQDAAPKASVAVYVRWTADSAPNGLSGIADPAEVIRAYSGRLRDDLGLDLELDLLPAALPVSAATRASTSKRHWAYHTVSHPRRPRTARRAVASGVLTDIFDQYALSDGSGLGTIHGASADTARAPAAAPAAHAALLDRVNLHARAVSQLIAEELFDAAASPGGGGSSSKPARTLLQYRGRAPSARLSQDPTEDAPRAPLPHNAQLQILLLPDIATLRASESPPTLSVRGQAPTSRWHLDRVDQAALPLNGQYVFPADLPSANITDQSWLYVVDSGMRTSHTEFAPSRAARIFDAYPSLPYTCDVHATHVAALAAGKVSGINPYARIFDARVLDCGGSGTISGLLQGLAAITDHCVASGGGAQRSVVINISLAAKAPAQSPEGRAIAAELGLAREFCDAIVVAAAGNFGGDACDLIPASLVAAEDGGVITVGASDIGDRRASFSSVGPCVAIHAPGVSLLSASDTSDIAFATLSGTSMASPVVAGIATLYTAVRYLRPGFPLTYYSDTVYGLLVVRTAEPTRITNVPTNPPTTQRLVQTPRDAGQTLLGYTIDDGISTRDAPPPPDPAAVNPDTSGRIGHPAYLACIATAFAIAWAAFT